ncbi:MAG: phosphate ABC transporter permease PstA [Victivallaceae bacterium]|nr:phosphate ABC transporter permease PstA [Victivallaceae bacterium]MDD3116468.1 phosphate ABC transporter permease PstA [Victivallaceae bacterium]MDD4316918.1 phosphate ABC transporter permease PstA [Victivallaceae bacterium]MDD5664033.1 phosphate ABC transporter permease PstA [Victivallaceae bacterium]
MVEHGFRRRPLFFRKMADILSRTFALLSVALAVSGMIWIIWVTISYGAGALSWEFLLEPTRPWGLPKNGVANAIIGTILVTFGAAVIGVPPAILGGIYLSEFGKHSQIGSFMRFCTNVMMGMPSIIIGLFVYAVMVVPTGRFSGFAGSLALAVIMFPVVMRTTEDILLMVSDTLRESALALGMSRTRTTLCIVCRSGRTGLITGILLAIARAGGETAPLLFTAMWSDAWPTRYFSQPTANLPVLINEYATNSPYDEVQAMGWGAALLITAAILGMNIVSRIFFREKKHG